MIALWYTDGRLERSPFQDGRARVQRMRVDPIALILEPFPMGSLFAHTWVEEAHRLSKRWRDALTRSERRSIARASSGRARRMARSVPCTVEHRVDALLYLPAGESVTQMHLDDVAMWLERNPA